MKYVLAMALFCSVSAAFAAPAFVCKSEYNDTFAIARVGNDIQVIINDSLQNSIVPKMYEPGVVNISVVADNFKMQFDRVSGLGTVKYQDRFSHIDCK